MELMKEFMRESSYIAEKSFFSTKTQIEHIGGNEQCVLSE